MDLKELLGEELFTQVTEKIGDKKLAVVSDGSYIPKDKFDAVNKEKNDYKKQVADRDVQLEDLKKVDAEGLQQKIADLQKANDDTKTEYEKQMQKQSFDYQLRDALKANKVRNAKAIKGLLDTEAIKLDGERLLGLDDQLKALKESDPYMFESEEPNEPNPVFSTGLHAKSGKIDATSFSKMSYKERIELKKASPQKYEELKGE